MLMMLTTQRQPNRQRRNVKTGAISHAITVVLCDKPFCSGACLFVWFPLCICILSCFFHARGCAPRWDPASICNGEAKNAAKLKIAVSLEPASSGSISAPVLSGLLASLAVVRDLVINGVAVNRGHKHSNGRAITCIWISSPAVQKPTTYASSRLSPDAIVFIPSVDSHSSDSQSEAPVAAASRT